MKTIPTRLRLIFLCSLIGVTGWAGQHVLHAADPSVERFDYHKIRGRQAVGSDKRRHEGELDFAISGTSRVQGMSPFGQHWSNGAHLLWDGAVGQSMESSFEVDEDGTYDISIQLTVAGDYGKFHLTMPESSLSRDVDLYDPRVELAPLLEFKNVRLKSGTQPIRFKLIGANAKARKFNNRGYLMGLDFLQLVRKDPPPDSATKTVSKEIDNAVPPPAKSFPAENTDTEQLSSSEVSKLTTEYCIDCHDGENKETEFDIGKVNEHRAWHASPDVLRLMRDALADHEMPPKDAKQPTEVQRTALIATMEFMIFEYLRQNQTIPATVMRRMNRYEYNNAVRDLLQLRGDIYPLPEKTIRAFDPYFSPSTGQSPRAMLIGNRTLGKNQVERQILTGVSPFAIDLQAEGGFNNRGAELGVSPIFLESLLRLGRSIVHSPEFDGYCGLTGSLFSTPVADNKEVTDNKEVISDVARKRLKNLLEQAFRIPVDAPMLNRYHHYFAQRLQETDSFRHAMKDTIAAILASPRFVYLAESSATADTALLNGYELATRLSFFLWSSIPDEELLSVARDGSLANPEVLDEQTRRMLRDPKCHALTQNFARQWLRLDQLVTAVPDFDRFPEYYSRIGCEQWKFGLQMMIEPLLLFDSIILEDRSIMLLIDCNYSYRSDELQSWYGDETPFANSKNRNRFNTNRQQYLKRRLTDRRQGGVITSAATMTMTSSPLRTNPITRGAWVATVILNRPPPPPPDIVPPIEADDRAIESGGLTLRQRLVQHQNSPTCAACHSRIDPLGFVLENYDAVGRWRNEYNSGLKIDSSGELLGKLQFKNVVDLKDALLDHPELFMRAFSEHMLSYALGRELELSDEPGLEKIVSSVMTDRGQFTTVVREIVQSHAFRYHAKESTIKETP